MSEIATNISNRIDELEASMQKMPKVDCPVSHSFILGFYVRQIKMPAGTLITSRIHKTEHPFVVTSGIAYVKINDEEWEEIDATEKNYNGITKPGTRRVIYIESDCTWTTFHATDIVPENPSKEAELVAVNLVAEQILEKHINPILGGELKNNIISHQIESQ